MGARACPGAARALEMAARARPSAARALEMATRVCPAAAKALEIVLGQALELRVRSTWPLGQALGLALRSKRLPMRSKLPSELLFEEYMLGTTRLCSTTLCCALLVHGYARDHPSF